MRSLMLVGALGLLAGVSTTASGQGMEMARYQRAAVRAVNREDAAEGNEKPKAFKGSQKDVAKMFASLDAAMSPSDSQRFHDIMGRFDKASNEDACWFGQQLYRGALALDSKRRDHTLHTLVWLEQ